MPTPKEILRYIQLNASNEPEPLFTLNDEKHFYMKSESFKIVPGVKQQVIAQNQRRWGGGRQVAETTENGAIEWVAGVTGATEQECLLKVEEMLAAMEANPYKLFLEWQAPAANEPTLYEARETATWTPEYEWAVFEGAQLFLFQVRVPVAPLALGLPVKVLQSALTALPATFDMSSIPGDAPAKAEVTVETGSEPNNSFITSASGPHGVAVNSEHIYWTNALTGDIGRASLSGASVEPAFITGCSKPFGIAINSEYIYWTNEGTGHIGRAKLAGTEVNQSFVAGATEPRGLAIDASYIYWANFSGTLGRAELAGTGVNQSFVSGLGTPDALAVNSEHLYWTYSVEGHIGRVKLSEPSKPELAFITGAAEPQGLALTSEYIYWASNTTGYIGRALLSGLEVNQSWLPATAPQGLTLNGEYVYWAVNPGGAIGRAKLAQAPPVWALLGWASTPTLAETVEDWITAGTVPYGVAVDSTYVYWTSFSTGNIGRALLSGEEANDKWITGAGEPYGIAVNSEYVFWTNNATHAIGKAKINGSEKFPSLITSASTPRGIAVAGNYLYWVNRGTGDIGRAKLNGELIEEVEESWITGATSPTGIAVSSTYVYWTNLTTGDIGRATIAGTEVTQNWITGATDPEGVAVNAEYVYWTNFGKGDIGRAPLNGGTPEQTRLTKIGSAYGIALDSHYIYWTTIAGDIGRASLLAGTPAPFGILDSEAGRWVNGLAYSAKTGARGGAALIGYGGNIAAYWEVNPASMVPDSFSGELAVEVWARMLLAPGLNSVTLTLSAQPQDGLGYGAARYTDEWGSSGRPVALPTGEAWRMTRLGVLHLLVNPLAPRVWKLWLAGESSGSDVEWGIDYLLAVPSTQRACSPSGKARNASYPPFITNTAPTVKTIRSDLSALIAKPGKYGHPDHGLGGQLLEFPPGEADLLVKLSSLVPDNPTASAATEQLAHEGTVSVTVTPRWYLARTA